MHNNKDNKVSVRLYNKTHHEKKWAVHSQYALGCGQSYSKLVPSGTPILANEQEKIQNMFAMFVTTRLAVWENSINKIGS